MRRKNGTEINDFLMPFVQQVVPTLHCNVTLVTQRKVIYCSPKTWPNEEVKYIAEGNSCFCNGRSLSQELWCVCRLWSKQENKWRLQQIKPTRACLPFAVVPLTTLPGLRTWDLTPYLYYLYIHFLPQPPKTLSYPQTLSYLHWAQQKTKSLLPSIFS